MEIAISAGRLCRLRDKTGTGVLGDAGDVVEIVDGVRRWRLDFGCEVDTRESVDAENSFELLGDFRSTTDLSKMLA